VNKYVFWVRARPTVTLSFSSIVDPTLKLCPSGRGKSFVSPTGSICVSLLNQGFRSLPIKMVSLSGARIMFLVAKTRVECRKLAM